MTAKPIIFSGPMVRALLDGRKTQTRRVVKDVPPQPAPDCHPSHMPKHAAPYLDAYCGARPTPQNPRGMQYDWHWWQVDDRPGMVAFRLPYAPGDLLWVREAHYLTNKHAYRLSVGVEQTINPADDYEACVYKEGFDRSTGGMRLRPSIHMPRWASRLTLRVTDVRVQRVQEISEEDAMSEGVEIDTDGWFDYQMPSTQCCPDARTSFRTLWDSLNASRGYGWDDNPWVAAYTFEVTRKNVDEVPA